MTSSIGLYTSLKKCKFNLDNLSCDINQESQRCLWRNKGDYKIESIFSMVKLRKVCSGARFDDDLFQLMSRPDTREPLRLAVINVYFAEEIQSRILECGNVNVKAYEYSKALLKGVKDKLQPWDSTESDDTAGKVRDQGFRKAIVMLYEHRCSLCGIRILTPEGHTGVDAAHVKPWSESFDDSPTNGMALCKLCHWSFDEGLMSVGMEYEVLVSKVVNLNSAWIEIERWSKSLQPQVEGCEAIPQEEVDCGTPFQGKNVFSVDQRQNPKHQFRLLKEYRILQPAVSL